MSEPQKCQACQRKLYFCKTRQHQNCMESSSGALSARELDRKKRFRLLRKNVKAFPKSNQPACGKCVTGFCILRSCWNRKLLFLSSYGLRNLIVSAFLKKTNQVLNLSLFAYITADGVEAFFERFWDTFINK